MIEIGPRTKKKMSYDDAWLYCATLTHDNYYNWRIPTQQEYLDPDFVHSHVWDQSDAKTYRLKDIMFPTVPVRDSD
jgi:hypothetical protein